MAKRIKRLSANDVLRVLGLFGFELVRTRGSHARLRRIGVDGSRQILTVPLHKSLDLGTVRAIYRQALRFVPEEDLTPHFFHE